MSDITITLTLTDDEQIRLQALTLLDAVNTGGAGDLNNKVARAIERAESFVDDDVSGNELVTCTDCLGAGKVHGSKPSEIIRCYRCSGTGKEYV